MALRIEDYIIGDLRSADSGRLRWFDRLVVLASFGISAACFAALLGSSENGRWLIAPTLAPLAVKRCYRPGTLVLRPVQTQTGRAQSSTSCLRQTAPTSCALSWAGQGGWTSAPSTSPRFNYGATVPWVRRLYDGAISAVAGPERLVLRSQVAPVWRRCARRSANSRSRDGQSVAFVPFSLRRSFQGLRSAMDPVRIAGAHGDRLVAGMERSVS